MEQKQIILKDLLIKYYANIVPDSKYSLIFLHGWRSEAKVWSDIIAKINYTSYALDLPGFGESQIPTKAYTLQDYSEVVEEFIKKLSIQNVVLIGHSNGGAISLKSIILNKFSTEKLVLVDSAGLRQSSAEKTTKNIIAKIVKPIFQIGFMKPLREKIYKTMGSEDYIAEPKLKQTYINIISEDLSSELEKIETPTLLIWGDKDQATPLSDGEFMHSKIKNSELKIIPGTEHFSYLENKELFANYLNDFLNS